MLLRGVSEPSSARFSALLCGRLDQTALGFAKSVLLKCDPYLLRRLFVPDPGG